MSPGELESPTSTRVKVLRSIAYNACSMKTKDFQVGDLDLKWTAEHVWTSRGPHAQRAVKDVCAVVVIRDGAF